MRITDFVVKIIVLVAAGLCFYVHSSRMAFRLWKKLCMN